MTKLDIKSKVKSTFICPQASSQHSQSPTVDVSQLHDPHSYSQHSIQVQHIQVSEPSGSAPGASQVKPSHVVRLVLDRRRSSPFILLVPVSGHQSASEPGLPAARSGAEPRPADPRHLSSESHPAGQQPPAAGGRAARRLHTRELELPRLP